MIDEIEREIEEKYVRKFAFNDERQFIFYDDLLFLLDKYNNQPDYKSDIELFNLANKTLKDENENLNKGIDELIEKCNKKIYYEKREISNNHNSFDHYRIIANCEEIIQDLKKLKGEQ